MRAGSGGQRVAPPDVFFRSMPPDNVRYEEEAPMKFLKSISLTAALAAGSLFAAPTFARVAVGVSVGFPPRAERVVVRPGPGCRGTGGGTGRAASGWRATGPT